MSAYGELARYYDGLTRDVDYTQWVAWYQKWFQRSEVPVNIVLDLASRSALRDGVPVTLTAKEFDLMELFLRNPNRVFSRTSLLDQVWGYEYQDGGRPHPAAAGEIGGRPRLPGLHHDQVGGRVLSEK